MSYSPAVRSDAGGWVARAVPDRANRRLLWLISLTSIALAVIGAIFGTSVVHGVYGASVPRTLAVLMTANLGSVLVGIAVAAAILRRARPITRPGPALAVGALTAGSAAAVKVVFVAIVGVGPREQMGPVFFAVMVMSGVMLFAALAAATLYAASREAELIESYAEIVRTQAALAHEEEAVRAQVFDHLHGTLQAEFVAMRQVLIDVAATSAEPDARQAASAVEARLEHVYRTGVESFARALSPAAIEGGLRPALLEMQDRLALACDVQIEFDLVAAALDDPMTGGLRPDLRLAAYRVVEEAVSNAVRHSAAERVRVRVGSVLRDERPALAIDISSPAAPGSAIGEGEGLRRMRARVAALGGGLRVAIEADECVVTAWLPVQRHAETVAS